MTDERFEELLRTAAPTYRRPPEDVNLDELWPAIERATFDRAPRSDAAPLQLHRRPRALLSQRWLRAAALVLLGVAVGRLSVGLVNDGAPLADTSVDVHAMSMQDAAITENYLDQATALLASLPAELRALKADSDFVAHANDLLLQTRRLLDAGALSDPALHALLEDLELVLVQVVRLDADPDPTKRDLLEESLENRDVLLRLRSAVASHSADD